MASLSLNTFGPPIVRSLLLSQICRHISPEFAYELVCTSGTDRESFAFARALLLKSIGAAVTRIREFAEDNVGPIPGIGEGQPVQSGCDAILQEVLSLHLFQVTSCDMIGVPRRHRVGMRPRVFHMDSWWIRDAPHLPLDATTTQARALAWYLYWFAEWR